MKRIHENIFNGSKPYLEPLVWYFTMISDLKTYPKEEKQTSCYSEEILITTRGRRMGSGKSRCIMIHWLCLILSRRRKTLLSNIGNVTPFGKRMDNNRRGWRIWIIGFFPLRIPFRPFFSYYSHGKKWVDDWVCVPFYMLFEIKEQLCQRCREIVWFQPTFWVS